MLKRDVYFTEAENLYINEHMTLKDIASKLNLNEKTVSAWKKMGGWGPKRKQYLKEKSSFRHKLYNFSITLMQSVKKDIAIGEKPHEMSLYALARILPILFNVEDYEDIFSKGEDEQLKLFKETNEEDGG